jgi:hypothetical protein
MVEEIKEEKEEKKEDDFSDFDDKLFNEEKEEKKENETDSLLTAFVSALKGITQIISDHTGLKSVALTDEDEKTLVVALKPLEKYIMSLVQFFVYMPLIVFTIGYTLRIVDEIKKKEKLKKATEQKTTDFTIKRELPNDNKE